MIRPKLENIGGYRQENTVNYLKFIRIIYFNTSNRCFARIFFFHRDSSFVKQWVRSEKSAKVKEKAAYEPRIEADTGLVAMKRLGVFLLPPGWGAMPSQGYPQH